MAATEKEPLFDEIYQSRQGYFSQFDICVPPPAACDIDMSRENTYIFTRKNNLCLIFVSEVVIFSAEVERNGHNMYDGLLVLHPAARSNKFI